MNNNNNNNNNDTDSADQADNDKDGTEIVIDTSKHQLFISTI